MPEIFLDGSAGRIQALYRPNTTRPPRAALVLHPHPQYGGSMHTDIVHHTAKALWQAGFSVLRINFRGVGRSEGSYGKGEGELTDATDALDWLNNHFENITPCISAGYSFGAWVAMQLLMRRPDVHRFIAISPPAGLFDFNFLAPCPTSGLFIHGSRDTLVSPHKVDALVKGLQNQGKHTIKLAMIEGADHYYKGCIPSLQKTLQSYIMDTLKSFAPEEASAPGEDFPEEDFPGEALPGGALPGGALPGEPGQRTPESQEPEADEPSDD